MNGLLISTVAYHIWPFFSQYANISKISFKYIDFEKKSYVISCLRALVFPWKNKTKKAHSPNLLEKLSLQNIYPPSSMSGHTFADRASWHIAQLWTNIMNSWFLELASLQREAKNIFSKNSVMIKWSWVNHLACVLVTNLFSENPLMSHHYQWWEGKVLVLNLWYKGAQSNWIFFEDSRSEKNDSFNFHIQEELLPSLIFIFKKLIVSFWYHDTWDIWQR